MTIPRWSTIVLFAAIVVQFIVLWVQAKKTGKSFRSTALPGALIAGAVSIIFAREFFGDLPVGIDVTIAILCSLIILFALGLWFVQWKRYVKEGWRLEDKSNK